MKIGLSSLITTIAIPGISGSRSVVLRMKLFNESTKAFSVAAVLDWAKPGAERRAKTMISKRVASFLMTIPRG